MEQLEAQLQQLRQQEAALDQRVRKLQATTELGMVSALAVLPKCLKGAGSTAGKPLRWPVWLRIRARAVVGRAVAPSAAVVHVCGVRFTWLRWWPLGPTAHSEPFCQRLRAAGKRAKVGLTALMRKLIVLMNHVLKNPSFQLAD